MGPTPVTVIASASPLPVSSESTSHLGPSLAGYRLVFDDEFSGSKIDRNKWTSSVPWGRRTPGEQQYYSPSALSEQGGMLTITASERATGGMPYTSGAISMPTSLQFTYGYIESRLQIPAGKGLWSAFWLLNREVGVDEEVDIMEIIGSKPSEGNAVLHYEVGGVKGRTLQTYQRPDFSADFHTFAVDWEPGEMTWYVDGVRRFKTTRNVPERPMTVIANLSVGGPTVWPGAPDRYTPFPAQYKIDYIRVYQKSPAPPKP